jgi:hypothetical protein
MLAEVRHAAVAHHPQRRELLVRLGGGPALAEDDQHVLVELTEQLTAQRWSTWRAA